MKNENGLSELDFSPKVNGLLSASLFVVADQLEQSKPGLRKLLLVNLALALIECQEHAPDLPEKDRSDIDYILQLLHERLLKYGDSLPGYLPKYKH